MKNRILFFLIAVILLSSSVSAQTWQWAQQSQMGIKDYVYASNVATNKTGNVYQTGFYDNFIAFGSLSLNSISFLDQFLVKYDANGNALWAASPVSTASGYSIAAGYMVATDDSDNAYVVGNSGNIDHTPDTLYFGSHTLVSPYLGYLYLVKYNANGKVLWATEPDTMVIADGSTGIAVATDKFGHEYITGEGSFLIKYDRNGNVIWTLPQTSNFFYYNYGTSVATDQSGNIYLSGAFQDSLTLGSYKLYSANEGEFIAKVDSNGAVLWAQQSNDNSYYTYYFNQSFIGNSVTVDPEGAAYLTGIFGDTIAFGSHLFISEYNSNILPDFYVVKYNPGGSIAWAKESVPLNINTSHGWGSYSISADDSNHIYIAGAEGVTGPPSSFLFANDTVIIAGTDSFDAPSFLLKLDTSGNVLCSTTLPDGGYNANGITSDGTGGFVYFGGMFFSDSINVGKTTLTNIAGSTNTFVAKWQACYQCNIIATANPESAAICPGSSVQLTAGGGTTYSWSPMDGLNSTTGSSVTANPTANTTYTVIVNPGDDCTATESIAISIIPAPNKPEITVSVTGDSLISSATTDNQWYFDGVLIPDSTRQVLVIRGHAKGWFSVTVTNEANGCSTTSDSTTSVNQLSVISEQLSIYPNPTNGSVFVKINSAALNINDWSLQVIDVLGRTLYTMSSLNYNNEIDLTNLASGVYFIAVVNKTGRAVFKVVKEN